MHPTPDTASADLRKSGLWLSISALVHRNGVKQQSISERVAQLEADGLLSTRPGPAWSKLVHVAEYDRAVGQIGGPAKQAGAATKSGAGGAETRDPAHCDAKAADAFYGVELRRIKL